MTDAWSLLDGEVQNAAHPRSFFIPRVETRRTLAPGDIVKVVVVPTGRAQPERLWVVVAGGDAVTGYVGRLDNEPVQRFGLSLGDELRFEPRHVVALYRDPDPLEDHLAFASARVFDDDDPGVGWATFDPDDLALAPRDDGRRASGWQFVAGDEPEGYLDDPDHVRVVSLPWMLERHPELAEPVRAHDGRALVLRRTAEGRYVPDAP